MAKQAKKLAAFIKPAAPNSSTSEQVASSTDIWPYTNLNILDQHYKQTQQHLVTNLPSFNLTALEKVISYGFSRSKKKLKPTTVSFLTQLVFLLTLSPTLFLILTPPFPSP